ncbi:hypothetical protein [Phreatobacter stygius]|uniref:Uncharacterized protein n=1 Tax=Phreatobacter stygius TaxID=1940610 RepID=A0A4D7BLA0_9HYPH|nr:hypothetical protein [Phreatobacter stygius]QCI68507.1 hypothetical protein E8M01_32340 [Phreatobacter stygius]
MGWNDHEQASGPDAGALRRRIEAGRFVEGSEEYLVADQVAREGIGSLSDRQRGIFDSAIQPILDEPDDPPPAASDLGNQIDGPMADDGSVEPGQDAEGDGDDEVDEIHDAPTIQPPDFGRD